MKHTLITIAVSALALASCQKQEAATSTQGTPVRFSAAFQTYDVKSVIDNTLENGSSLGVYAANPIGAVNVQYNKDDNATTLSAESTGISWNIGQNGTQDFYAYYPYSGSANASSIPVAISTNQSVVENLNASDFVWGSATGVEAGSSAPVILSLNHKLTKVIIRIDNNLAVDVSGVAITGLHTATTAVPSTGVLGEMTGSGNIQAFRNVANDGWDDNDSETVDTRNREYVAIVLPEANVNPTIVVSVASGYEYTFALTAAYSFVAGHTATASLTLNPEQSQTGAAVDFGFSMGVWTDGADMGAQTTTPTPTKPANRWSVIGTINGTAWDQDFYMESSGGQRENEVKITFNYTVGDAFKLRYNNDWETQAGASTSDPLATGSDITLAGSNNHDIILSGGAGSYTIYFDPSDYHFWINKNE